MAEHQVAMTVSRKVAVDYAFVLTQLGISK